MAKKVKESQGSDTRKLKKSISGVLLSVLLPVTALAIVFIILFLTTQAKNTIVKQAKSDLMDVTIANAYILSEELLKVTDRAEEVACTIDTLSFNTIDELQKYLEHTQKTSDLASGGIYVGSERGWYKEGINYSVMTGTEPYMDATTNSLCVTFCRKVTPPDNVEGVAAVDIYLDKLTEEVNNLTPLGTGRSAVLAKDMVISYYKSEFNGKNVADCGDDYLTRLKEYVDTGRSYNNEK